MDLSEVAETYGVKIISDNIRFWMIRTKKGYFYREFVKKGYVALGWNEIHQSTDISDEEKIKEYIK